MAKEVRLIDANILEERVSQEPTDGMYTHEIIAAIKEQPTVDAAPVIHARWEDVRETVMYVPDVKATFTHTAETCSACKARVGFVGPKMYLYDKRCPECGAKMDLTD